jgi:hypothetical protein
VNHGPVFGQIARANSVNLSVWIGTGGPETQPDTIAQLYWDLYTKREGAEHHYNAF